jgi:hypothetical protein
MFVPKKPFSFASIVSAQRLFNKKKSYYYLSLGSLPFTFVLAKSTGLKVIKWNAELLTYISGHKVFVVVVIIIVTFIHDRTCIFS